MEKKLRTLFLVSLFFTSLTSINAQCRILKDSITAGEDATSYSNYEYEAGLPVKINHIDSGQTQSFSYDTIHYNSSGLFIQVDRFSVNDTVPRETTVFTRDGNNLITSVTSSGDDNGTPWSITHNISYSGSTISSIILDTAIGDPEGFDASFSNMVWTGGNVTSLDLIGDLGSGIDTIELTLTYDSKNNYERLRVPDEASDLFSYFNINNITDIVFTNTETAGPAGTVVQESNHTYNGEEVATITELPSLFEDATSTTALTIDCATGLEEQLIVNSFILYPNPANELITITLKDAKKINVTIANINGQVVFNNIFNGNKTDIDISNLRSGIYTVEIQNENQVLRQKLIKN